MALIGLSIKYLLTPVPSSILINCLPSCGIPDFTLRLEETLAIAFFLSKVGSYIRSLSTISLLVVGTPPSFIANSIFLAHIQFELYSFSSGSINEADAPIPETSNNAFLAFNWAIDAFTELSSLSKRILEWFYYSKSDDNKSHLKEKVKAVENTTPFPNKFPSVVYSPSYQASSVENFALCEFLASQGFVVILSPSRGTENRLLEGGTTRDIETQARDIQFPISEIGNQSFADINNLAVMGFSFGGISNVLAQMMDKRIKAIICLDGSIKYQYQKIQSSPYFNLFKVDVPFLFMSQKDIPTEVMKKDKIDSTLNTKFEFYDSVKYSEAYFFKFNNMTHSYFSSMGVLFQDRDVRQDKSDTEIMDSYRWVNIYTLNFLNAFLNNQNKGKAFWKINLP